MQFQSPPSNRLPVPGQFPPPQFMTTQQGIIPYIQSPIKQSPIQYSPQPVSYTTMQQNQSHVSAIQRSPMSVVQPTQLRASPSSHVLMNQVFYIRYIHNSQPLHQSIIIPQSVQQVQQVQQLQQVQQSQIIERIEQPLQLVDLYAVEEPWRLRVLQLESEIAQINGQPVQQFKAEQVSVFIQDDSKNNETEKELSQSYAQIQQLINTIKILQEENQTYQYQTDEKKRKAQDLEEQLRLKEREIQEALNQIDDLNAQLDDMSLETEEKHSFLIKEVNTWKQKFVELNREFHTCQEAFMLAQAELDNLKNASVQISKTTTTTTTNTKSESRNTRG